MSKTKDHSQHIELAVSPTTLGDPDRSSNSSSYVSDPITAKGFAPHAVRCEPHHIGKLIYLDGPPNLRPTTTNAEHGPLIDDETPKPVHEYAPHLTWSRIRSYCREPFAEFWGVFILVMFGDGVVAQVTLSGGEKGNYQSISWGWGLGVMLGVYVSGLSGAHLNPAVTLSNCVFRKFPWRKFPGYMIGQFLGGFCAAGVVYANYLSA